MHPLAGHHMPAEGVDQRAQQPRALPDPVGQRRPLQVDTGPLVDLALPIQRQMVGKLRDQHMGQQTGRGASAADRHLRRRRLGDALADTAREFWAHVADDPERRRDVVQHLGDVLAEPAQCTATLRAGAGGLVRDRGARQMIGKRSPRGSFARRASRI